MALLNILYHEESLREAAGRGTYLQHSLQALESIGEDHKDLFVRLRFIFLCTLIADGAKTAAEETSSIAHIVTVLLHKHSDH